MDDELKTWLARSQLRHATVSVLPSGPNLRWCVCLQTQRSASNEGFGDTLAEAFHAAHASLLADVS